jgi:hypothetical protein
MVENLPEGVRWRMVWFEELKRRVPSPNTNRPSGLPSPGMVTVVTVASRAAGRARLGAEYAAIFAEGGALKLGRWGFETAEELGRAQVSQERSLLKPKPTNRRAASSIRVLLEARRRRALLRRARSTFCFVKKEEKKKCGFLYRL